VWLKHGKTDFHFLLPFATLVALYELTKIIEMQWMHLGQMCSFKVNQVLLERKVSNFDFLKKSTCMNNEKKLTHFFLVM